ncbi:MAG: HAD family hydrolase [Clostridia bacterium]|nr:HAD family hydrolase [Clostridia bacterium]
MFKLVACDIDGTLLRGDGTASDRLRQAMQLAKDRGASTTLVTGRRIAATTPVAVDLDVNGPLVAHCGAVVYSIPDEEILMAKHMPREVAVEICNMAKSVGAHVSVYENAHLGRSITAISQAEVEDIRRWFPHPVGCAKLAASFEEACCADPVQVSIQTRGRGAMASILAELATTYASEVSLMDYGVDRSGTALVDVFAHGVHKGLGLEYVARCLDVDRAEIVAFGDSDNDIELLRYAGLGVAMGNASTGAARAADMMAPSSNDDGVAVILEDLACRGMLGSDHLTTAFTGS